MQVGDRFPVEELGLGERNGPLVSLLLPAGPPMHSHSYDEIVYVIDGEGTLHLGGQETPIAAWVSHASAAARRALSGEHRKGVYASTRRASSLG
jgi:hypothetical protein